jgi:PAS domain S-box-containing protein
MTKNDMRPGRERVDAAGVLALLGEVTSALETRHGPGQRFQAIADAVVPRWAAGMALRLVAPSGSEVVFEGMRGATGDEPFRRDMAESLSERAIVLPLTVGSKRLGALALMGDGERSLEAFDAKLARELSARIAGFLACEEAKAHAKKAQEAVERLERELLALATRENRYREAHELSFDSVVILHAVRDASGCIFDFEYVYANPVSLKVVRRPLHDVLGNHLLTLVPGHREHEALFGRFVRVVETGEANEMDVAYEGEGISGVFQSVAAKLDDGVVVYFHDITKQKQQERALRESELRHRQLAERYGALVTALAETVWTAKVSDGQATTPPPGLVAQQDAGLGRASHLDAIHPDDRTTVLETWRAAVEHRRPFAMGYRVQSLSSGYRYVHGRAVPVFEPDGRVREWVGVCIDEDERKRAEELLRSRERELLALAEGAPDIMARFDVDRRIRYVNPPIAAWTSLAPEQCVGKTVAELDVPEEVSSVMDSALGEVFGSASGRAFTIDWPDASPDTICFEARLEPELDDDGRVQGVIAVIRDLTEIRRREQALRESESILKIAQRSARMGVWALDFEPLAGRWSDESNVIYGRDPSLPSPTYDEWLALIHPEDRPGVERCTHRVLAGLTDDWRLEFRIHHPQLGERWLLEVGHRDGAHAAGITLDVTNEKRTEERLRQAAKLDAVGRLAGGLAHDFNNQLQVVRGFAGVVAKDPGLGDRSRAHLQEIGKAVEHMRSSTAQLLAFSRQQVLAPETVDLDAAVAEAEPLLDRLASKGHTRLEIALDPEPKWVRFDRAQLMQVLLNLTLNARDAMPDGGVITFRTRMRDEPSGVNDARAKASVTKGRYAELAVSDTGKGIPQELLGQIFDPFFTTKEVGRGAGLGLATVHGIVSQSGGYIWATSTPGQGTTFTILLPLTPEPPAPKEEAPSDENALVGRRILVVEDESAVRRFLAEALESGGCEVVEAAHGLEALERLESLEGAVDLVVSDATMPVMSGPELCRELGSRYPELPIVWISGYTRETAFEGGALGRDRTFLQKPISAEKLVEVVARATAGT